MAVTAAAAQRVLVTVVDPRDCVQVGQSPSVGVRGVEHPLARVIVTLLLDFCPGDWYDLRILGHRHGANL
jgi:hypothetical protein